MSPVEVLFFAADPKSAGSGGQRRLLIDEEVRQIRLNVRLARHRDLLSLNTQLAARTDDMVQALSETKPQVIHFSGHGGSAGLVLVAADGRSEQRVDTDGLREFFKVFRGRIRLVVLNACLSLPQAQAIAEVVGCAIGTPDKISDRAAITFASSFYRAVAFGESVQAAFDQARAALRLESFAEREYPQLLHRKDVDPARLVLIPGGSEPVPPPPARRARRVTVAATALLLTAGTAAAIKIVGGAGEGPVGDEPAPRDSTHVNTTGTDTVARPETLASTRNIGTGTDGTAELAAARDLRDAGNHAAAFPLFQKAAEAGNTEAMAFLGIAYLNGEGTERQPRQAIQWLRDAAEARDPRGMNALGVAYQDGLGVNRNHRWAKHWLREAAERDYAPAMRNLGNFYRRYVDPDSGYALAMEWYRKAGAAGDADGWLNLGLMHERGMGTQPDTAEALRLYLLSAEAGNPDGMVHAGQVYEHRQEYNTAREWYLKAVDAGSADGMNNMGVLYHNGWGVRRNREEAIRWFRQAAQAGSTTARGNLAALGVR
ncbi:CHAT domain-containing protein [Longimicrobium sp.]|uniref:CHAT domain-containing protein n=1 Tax=Longimicrobium sp. TaxID=2029185 RepID=UPI002E33EA70|nr:CHAT domain-containing protein [Longimicrobium sp.]HEX6037330.1 CHAT domain-containing protein [Longimicrobium sp.]